MDRIAHDSTRVERHPIADLLTDEMRERVARARFSRYGDGIATPGASWDTCFCPLAVAFGWTGPHWPDAREAAAILGTCEVAIVADFIRTVDGGSEQISPDDVYVMLGVEPVEDPS